MTIYTQIANRDSSGNIYQVHSIAFSTWEQAHGCSNGDIVDPREVVDGQPNPHYTPELIQEIKDYMAMAQTIGQE